MALDGKSETAQEEQKKEKTPWWERVRRERPGRVRDMAAVCYWVLRTAVLVWDVMTSE
jgi:hypothetical protein